MIHIDYKFSSICTWSSTWVIKLCFTMILIIFIFMICQFSCNAYVIEISCNDTENYCIGEYIELQSFIQNDTIIPSQLSEAFYRGGKETDFVKINYKFIISNVTTNDTSDLENNCYSREEI